MWDCLHISAEGKCSVAFMLSVNCMYTYSKYVFDWVSKSSYNNGFHRAMEKKNGKKTLFFLCTHSHTRTTQARMQNTHTGPVYSAQGVSGADTITKRQVISKLQTGPPVRSDQRQSNTAEGWAVTIKHGNDPHCSIVVMKLSAINTNLHVKLLIYDMYFLAVVWVKLEWPLIIITPDSRF